MVYSSSLSSVWSCEVPAWQLCFKSSYRIATTNKMQYFLDLFISINCCTCFRRFLRPSSGAQNYIQHQLLSNQYCCLLLSLMRWNWNCSTCFRRFLRPSSGAQNCTYSISYCQTNTAACCYRGWDGTAYWFDNTWRCMYSFVLLMGGGTAWNM